MKRNWAILLGLGVVVLIIVGVGAFIALDDALLRSQKVDDYFVSKEGMFDKINQTDWEVADLNGYYLTSYRWMGGRYFLVAIRNQKGLPMLIPIFVEGKGWGEGFDLPPFVEVKENKMIDDWQKLKQALSFGKKIQFALLVSASVYFEDGGSVGGASFCKDDTNAIYQRLCKVAKVTANNWGNKVKDWYLAKGLVKMPPLVTIGGKIVE